MGAIYNTNKEHSPTFKPASHLGTVFELITYLVGDAAKSERNKHQLTNDDLLYDPDADQNDEKWVQSKRQAYQPKAGQKKRKPQNSDAVLDCPACMTTLCLDCQR